MVLVPGRHPRRLRRGDVRQGPCGKLTAAARVWAYAQTGRVDPTAALAIDEADAAAFAALGVQVEIDEEHAPAEVEVWPENWAAVVAFLDLSTQWRAVLGPTGLVWLGLDYTAVDVLLRRRGDDGDEIFEAIRLMEQDALPILNERGDA